MTNYLLDDWVYNVCTNILSHREKGPLQPIEGVEASHMGHYSPGTCKREVLPICHPERSVCHPERSEGSLAGPSADPSLRSGWQQCFS